MILETSMISKEMLRLMGRSFNEKMYCSGEKNIIVTDLRGIDEIIEQML